MGAASLGGGPSEAGGWSFRKTLQLGSSEVTNSLR